MNRYTWAFDGTLPLTANLYEGEHVIASQDGVELMKPVPYLILPSSFTELPLPGPDSNQKSLDHQLGIVHVTSHRLVYIDVAHPHSCSLALPLAHVTQTDYYAGFLKSSPKVTLFFSVGEGADAGDFQSKSWICHVCSYRNPSAFGDAARKCGLCGVTRDASTRSPAIQTPPTSSLQDSPYSGNITSFLSSSAIAVPQPRPQDSIVCAACTFLNHPSLQNCEICGTPLELLIASPGARSFRSAPTSRPETPSSSSQTPTSERNSIKISFRNGGDKTFYAALKRTLMGKAWETKINRGTSPSGNTGDGTPFLKSGIHGILQNVDESARATDMVLHSALRDLEALMAQAKDMVELTSSLNAKLTAQEEQRAQLRALRPELTTHSPEEPEEVTFIRSSLSQLGLQTVAVTQDMVKDEKEWAEQLAKELGSVLNGSRNAKGAEQEGLMRQRGIVALDEIWGGWNRARGVALIPPETMLLCLPYLPSVTNPPIRLRTFRSGLRVLHTSRYTEEDFSARLMSLISSGPHSTVEIAKEEGISVALATEMIEAVEDVGDILRDEQTGDVRWWQNTFRGYTWDGVQ